MTDGLPSRQQPAGAPDFGSMYEDEFDYVWTVLRRLGVPGCDLEDVAHEVFMVAYQRFDDYDSTRRLRPWLFGIALKCVADYRKRAHRRHEVSEGAEPESNLAAPDAELSTRRSQQLLLRALDALGFDQRAVLVLHEIEERTMPEIAEITSTPLNTCYSRLRLARATLATEVRRLTEGEDPR